MFKNIFQNKSLKYTSFWLISAIFSLLIKFYCNLPGNLDLLFGLQLFLAQFFGPLALGSWTALNIFSYDLYTGNLGFWSLVTASTYFWVSYVTKIFISAHEFLPLKHKIKPKNYNLINFLIFTIIITVFYDLMTASTGPIFFNQAWSVMLAGQVPFTLIHLLSNCASTSLFYLFLFKSFYKKLVPWLWFVATKLGSRYVTK
ncbi:MAG TPA: hypothetical protein VJJ81_04515 [Candidatus Babeliales bacterium]|nr:hypothetical protein [Candidatus Babeliales bacterium]